MTSPYHSSHKTLYTSPTHINEVGNHYILENGYQKNSPTHLYDVRTQNTIRNGQNHYSTLSPTHHSNEYVIVLDSGFKETSHKADHEVIETNNMERDSYYQGKFMEFEQRYHSEIEEIKERIMSECRVILVD